VISNPTKRVQTTEVTAAEDVSLLHLREIAKRIREIYSPGAVFQIVSDSTFYAMPLGVTSVESQNYLKSLQERITGLGIADTIKISDISDYLAYNNQAFHERFALWRRRFISEPIGAEMSAGEYRQWHASMKATINSRRMSLEYPQMVSLFDAESSSAATDLDQIATIALAEYRALKAAAADMQWEDRYFPSAVRGTIHIKKIPVLGLRLYPEYKITSRLLPYHGISVVVPSGEDGTERMEIRHEITVIGNPAYTRVVDAHGLTQFYEPSDLGR